MKSLLSLTSPTTVLFLTDLHMNRMSESELNELQHRIRNVSCDSIIVTGDISNAANLKRHLSLLAASSAPRALYFVTGNHDYYGSTLSEVEEVIAGLCKSTPNLNHLDGNRVIQLANGIGLVEHRGWPDAQAGDGMSTEIENPDRWNIKDFRHYDHEQMLMRMRAMGKESADQIRSVFPLALTCYRHVIVATHVPPFSDAVYHKGKPSDRHHLPHFCNLSVGLALIGISRAFPQRRVSVLAGHSHSSCFRRILPNLSVRIGTSRAGGTIPFELLRLDS